jgi:ribonuclease HII
MKRFVIGVDEAGRGPLAGPVAVGVVRVPARYNIKKNFPGLDDSKKLSPQKREELFALLKKRAALGELQFCVRFSSHTVIDTVGITRAVRRAAWSGVRALAQESHEVRVMLDGLLTAPPEYEQETVIHGDALVPAISLASVAAKVVRDAYMRRLGKRFPEYNFQIHKGYGTARHRAAIAQFGLCEVHRQSFCKSFK